MSMEAEGNRNIDCSAGPCCSRLIPAPEFLLVDLVHRDLAVGEEVETWVRLHRNALNWGTAVRRNPEKDTDNKRGSHVTDKTHCGH